MVAETKVAITSLGKVFIRTNGIDEQSKNPVALVILMHQFRQGESPLNFHFGDQKKLWKLLFFNGCVTRHNPCNQHIFQCFENLVYICYYRRQIPELHRFAKPVFYARTGLSVADNTVAPLGFLEPGYFSLYRDMVIRWTTGEMTPVPRTGTDFICSKPGSTLGLNQFLLQWVPIGISRG
jgi:hypothetical protein